MKELETFVEHISALHNSPLDIAQAREIVNEINKFLYTSNSNLGVVSELGQEFPYFSAFHKFWHQHHKEILDLQISQEACEKVADALYDVYIRTNGKAFKEIYDTNNLSKKDICRVRLLTANQDFRGSRKFVDLSEVFLADQTTFNEKYIFENPGKFVEDIGVTTLSQSDKRVQYAKKISQFLLEHKSSPYDIIKVFDNDVSLFRKALISYEGAGYGNKKTDMFIRDMVVLDVWPDVKGFDSIDVASDINTIKVALRTGILKSAIPLVSSFLDIFCYQYGYVDEMNALAWRKVWEIWRKKYPDDTISSPCLLDYFIYSVVGKQFCKNSLYLFVCEKDHSFYWHSSQNRTCQVCHKKFGKRNKAKLLSRLLPCEVDKGYIAIENTNFVRSNIASPNYKQCPFKEICEVYGNKYLLPPKSISIMGKTGWATAYVNENTGGGGLMS